MNAIMISTPSAKQHRLQDVRAVLCEPEQDRERPAAGKRCAEHLAPIRIAAREDGE